MQYLILSSDIKQADYFFRRTKAILNPIVDRVFPTKFEMVIIGETRIRFVDTVTYYAKLQDGYHDAIVMRDVRFEEALKEYMKTVKDLKEIVKDETHVSNT